MPSYRSILTVSVLKAGHDPGDVESAARGTVRRTTVLEAFQVDVVRGEPRVTVRFTGSDDAEARGVHARVVETIGASAAHVVAVDLPSGIDADTGRVLGAAVRANRTVTFHRMKRGLELAPEYAGRVTVAPIGIPGPEIPCVALPSGP